MTSPFLAFGRMSACPRASDTLWPHLGLFVARRLEDEEEFGPVSGASSELVTISSGSNSVRLAPFA